MFSPRSLKDFPNEEQAFETLHVTYERFRSFGESFPDSLMMLCGITFSFDRSKSVSTGESTAKIVCTYMGGTLLFRDAREDAVFLSVSLRMYFFHFDIAFMSP